MELTVSLIYLIKHVPKEGYDTKQKIIEYLQSQKPQFSTTEIEDAWSKIKKAKIWKSHLEKLGE